VSMERTCGHCGAPLHERVGQARYCDPTCRRRARGARERATFVPKGRPATIPAAHKHKPGDRHGSLVIVERLGRVNGSVRVSCRCDCGNVKALGLPNLLSGATVNCADRENHLDPRHKGEDIGYDGAHNRVKAIKGSASQFPCAECGGPARHWAYSHADAAELRMTHGRQAGSPYSANPDHYAPMCVKCHARFDSGRRQWAPGEGLSLEYLARWAFANPDAFNRQFAEVTA
jgi:cytochrome c553